jgi:transposase-like protein
LEAVVIAKRDQAAALKLLKRIIKRYGRPRLVVTDALRAYSTAKDDIGAADRHQVGHRLNIGQRTRISVAALSRFEVTAASNTSPSWSTARQR